MLPIQIGAPGGPELLVVFLVGLLGLAVAPVVYLLQRD